LSTRSGDGGTSGGGTPSGRSLERCELLDLVRMQTALGPRVPGSAAHQDLVRILASRLAACADETHEQRFPATFHGLTVECTNLLGFFRSREKIHGDGHESSRGPLLLGTHFDTRPRADREIEPAKREIAIPGANDGGSGTAILLHMLDELSREKLTRDVVVAFFDAEDLGDIDGNPFSVGAEYLVSHSIRSLPACSEVVILDMVGGAGMVLDIDAHCLHHQGSRELTRRLFTMGAGMGAAPFTEGKSGKLKYLISDHWPFLRRGIPSCLLIDIDYPQWHTLADLPEAMSERSLSAIEEVLSLYLWRPEG
jgi:hypothetical protein